MSAWGASLGLGQRIAVSAAWPQLTGERRPAVIVANAAKNHRAAAQMALRAGAPVLVEKPVALKADEVTELMALADSCQAQFAAAHVFLFARYLDNFRQVIAPAGRLRQIRLRWTDPRAESRYGEAKYYDPSLPVYADCLPHMMSMIGSIVPNHEPALSNLEFYRGGAQLKLELAYGDTRCLLEFARNSERRERLLEVEAHDDKVFCLDFSQEPGTIEAAGIKTVGDPDWNTMPHPVASMLTSFLKWAAGGASDWRLNIKGGLQACRMIDQVAIGYRESQLAWLESRFDGHDWNDRADLSYALSELLQLKGALPHDVLDQQSKTLQQDLARLKGQAFRDRLISAYC